MEYDPTRGALFRPGDATQFFFWGAPDSDPALCAEMSRLAYCRDGETVERNLARVGFPNYQPFDEGGTQATLASGGERAILAFRGTEGDDPTDIIVDALLLPERWESGGKVHMGFAKALEHVWQVIEPHLKLLDVPVLFTGHSLGAALATLAASRHPSAGLFTFGSPRVGDAAFRETLTGVDIHRFVNCCDLVCQVPPKPYRHVGTLHYIDREGNVSVNPDASMIDDDKVRGRAEYLVNHAWRYKNLPVRDLADHAPINYVSALV